MDRARGAGGVSAVDARTMAKLVAAAKGARKNAYAPYSKFRVGAAIVTKSGAVFTGCNVENASYGATICAERNAIAQMVAAGESEPVACAVVTAGPRAASPCGMCRQVLFEFAADMAIALVAEGARGDARRDTTLAELLPDGFLLKRRELTKRPSPKRRAKS
jgi:cytidine deaminase